MTIEAVDALSGRLVGPRLGNTPYEEVAIVFHDFRRPNPRGGIRINKPPYLNRLPNDPAVVPSHEYSCDYHVQTTFSEIQGQYVVTTLAYLTALAKGDVLGSDETVPSFAERVQTHYLSREDDYFCLAVGRSILNLLSEFGTRNPNLMPAASAIFQAAGVMGLMIIEESTSPFLADASEGKLRADNIDDFFSDEVSRKNFIQAHPRVIESNETKPREYEVECAGEAFAKELIRQAKIAAVHLVASGNTEKFRGLWTTGLQSRIEELVAKLSEDARRSYRERLKYPNQAQ